ncbi:hypothetical protein P4S73_05455 [Paraglaciecola sp. Hal342]
MNKTVKKSILVAAAAALFSANSFAEVTRHALPNNNPFPISRAVEVTPDTTLIFHAGMPQAQLIQTQKRAVVNITATQKPKP